MNEQKEYLEILKKMQEDPNFECGKIIMIGDAIKDNQNKLSWTDIAKMMPIDNVNHPNHYIKGGLECIKVIKAQLTKEQYQGYLYGNVLKYMWRWQDKNGLEDLRKAAKYLEWLQEEVKK